MPDVEGLGNAKSQRFGQRQKGDDLAVTGRLLHINVQRFRGGLVFKAHRRLYHSTLDLRVIKKKKKVTGRREPCQPCPTPVSPPRDAPVQGFGFRVSGFNLRTTTLQKCAAVPRRARI